MDNKARKKRANRAIMAKIIFLMVSSMLALTVVLAVQLYKITIVDHDFYERKAIEQQTRDTIISPARGTIYDRNMKPLAISASVETVYISPNEIRTYEGMDVKVARFLSGIFEQSYDSILEKTTKKTYYVIIQKKIERDLADEIREGIEKENLKGIHIEPDSKRYYPYGDFASNVIGFVRDDNTGLEGLEAVYENALSGTAGRIITAKAPNGTSMPFEYEKYYDAEDGNDLVLNIDETIQHFLERHLETAVVENEVANRAAGIVMDVNTGGILGMSTKAGYDLNNPRVIADPATLAELSGLTDEAYQQRLMEAQLTQWRNKAVSDTYEPGSTFKIITASIALEENVVKQTDSFNCSGSVMVPGWGKPINCHKRAGHGTQTFVEGVQNSCNPVFIAVAQRIGRERFYSYMKAFGLMEKTGIDLSGESGSVYHAQSAFNDVALAVYSFGQTFQITPIQLITAISAVANGGNLYKPRIVSAELDGDGKVVTNYEPELVRKVVSESTSRQMREILESVVSSGTGHNAYVKGYRIAGKTGTSQKRNPETNQYETGKYIVSFAGFAPADDPKVAVLIMLDEPMYGPANLRSGGNMAAPVVGRIMADILPYIGVNPQYSAEEIAEGIDKITPNLKDLSISDAEKLLKEKNYQYKIVGDGDIVTDQIPASGAKVTGSAQIILYLGGQKPEGTVKVPDVLGKGPEKANQLLTDAGLYIRVSGATSSGSSGVVAAAQDIEAGTEVPVGTVVKVEFRDNSSAETFVEVPG